MYKDLKTVVARPEGVHNSFVDKPLDSLTGDEAARETATAPRFVANRNQRLGGRSWVYFAQRGRGGPVKIGRTRSLSERICALQSVCPEDVTLLGKIPETMLSEASAHARLKQHRIRGEWFHPARAVLQLAAAGKHIYASGFTNEIADRHTRRWLLIRSYQR
jgi:hypothetical protein